MRTTKRCFLQFDFYDRTGIQKYLEKQAEKGWMLEKISAFGWRFRRAEPRKRHFSVNYFPKASVFDPEPSEKQQQFQEFCAHTGWQIAATNAQMQIFFNEKEEPIPIETDAEMEIENIHNAMKKGMMPSWFLLLFCALLQMGLFIGRLSSDPIGVLASNINLFTGFCWLLILFMIVGEAGSYFLWRKKAKRAAELDGSFVTTKGRNGIRIAVLCLMFAALGLMLVSFGSAAMVWIYMATVVVILGVTALVLGFSALMKRLKAPAATNRVATIAVTLLLSFGITGILLVVIINGIMQIFPEKIPSETYEYKGHSFRVYDDELPVTVEDLTDVNYDEYSRAWTVEESILLAQFHAYQRPRMDALEIPDLKYTITMVKLPILYDWCLQEMLNSKDNWYSIDIDGNRSYDVFKVSAAESWGANAAYQLFHGEETREIYLICFEKCIVRFEPDWKLTEEQMRIIGEKLNIK